MLELATLSGGAGRAQAVNAGGVVVGWSLGKDGSARAVIWDAHGNAVDLNSLVDARGWLLQQATRIDDDGSVHGIGLKNGVATAFRISPAR